MKKPIYHLIATIASIVVISWLFMFAKWNFDVSHWDENSRGYLGTLILLAIVVSNLFVHARFDNKKIKQ